MEGSLGKLILNQNGEFLCHERPVKALLWVSTECLQQTKWLVKTRVKGRDHMGLIWGINRNSTYEQNNRRTQKSRKNIWSNLKRKWDSEKREKVALERREKVEYTRQKSIACITRIHFPPSLRESNLLQSHLR